VKDWGAPFSADDANRAALDFAEALVNGEIHTAIPRSGNIVQSELDYSVSSVERIESYLFCLHKDFARWVSTGVLPIKSFGFKSKRQGQDQLTNAIFQCGSYIGEVIRRTGRPDLKWIRHQEWSRMASRADLKLLGASAELGTTLMLKNTGGELWLPFEKVLKFLEFGMQDSVVSFVAVVGAQRKNDVVGMTS
jgi:hypothetical protein